jgi:hypothetical protein
MKNLPINRLDLKIEAKKRIRGKVIKLLPFELAMGLITFILVTLSTDPRDINSAIGTYAPEYSSFNFSSPFSNTILIRIAFIVLFLFRAVFAYSNAKGFYKLSNDYDFTPDTSSAFYGFKDFKRAFVLYCINTVFIFLWTLLLIIPGIVKSFSYSQSFFILQENRNIQPNDARKISMKLMDGHKMDLFVLYLSFIPWYILSVITLGIGYIYAYPYIQTTLANFYKTIK